MVSLANLSCDNFVAWFTNITNQQGLIPIFPFSLFNAMHILCVAYLPFCSPERSAIRTTTQTVESKFIIKSIKIRVQNLAYPWIREIQAKQNCLVSARKQSAQALLRLIERSNCLACWVTWPAKWMRFWMTVRTRFLETIRFEGALPWRTASWPIMRRIL